jgi:hypothetical protein
VPAVFLALSVWSHDTLIAHLGTRLPGSADGILFSWYFESVEQSLVHLHNPLFSSALNAPAGVNVMWNTALLPLAVVCSPLTAAVGPFATVGVLFILSPALSATTAFLVLRRLTRHSTGAALGSAMYGFGPFFVGQFGHLHLLFAVFPPLLVLFGHRLLVAGTDHPVRLGVWLGAVTGVQLLISEELVVLCTIAVVVALFWLAVVNYRELSAFQRRWRTTATALGWAAGVGAAVVAIPLGYEFFGRQALPHGVRPGTARADLASLVRPSLLQHFASHESIAANLHYPANGAENTAYLGWPLLCAIAVICVWGIVRRERFILWWAPTFASLIVLSLGSPISINGHDIGRGPWALVRRLPLVGGAQPVRFSLLVTLMVAALIAWLLARCRGWHLMVLTAISAAMLLPLLPAHPAVANRIPVTPAFFTSEAVEQIPTGAITVVLPQAAFPRVNGMVYQIRSGLRFDLVGGYSVFEVHGRSSYVPVLPDFVNLLRKVDRTGQLPDPAEVAAAHASVSGSGVRYIVITDHTLHPALLAQSASLITGCTPRQSADVVICRVPG